MRRLFFLFLLFPPPAAALDLGQIFPGWSAWEEAADGLETRIGDFATLERTRFDDAASLARALEVRDDVFRRARVVEGYVSLRLQLDGADAEALRRQPRLDEVTGAWDAASSWFAPALVATGPETIAAWSAPGAPLAGHRHFLRRTLRLAAHQAPDGPGFVIADRLRLQLQRAHSMLSTAEAAAPTVALGDGTALTLTPAVARSILWEIPDAADRQAIQEAWLGSLARQAGTRAALLAGIVLHERDSAAARGYASPLEAALDADGLPPAAVRSALTAAQAGAEPLRRYHRLRRRLLGLERYGTADRFVPLSPAALRFTWDEARELVVESAGTLGPQVRATAERAFSEGWIDAGERPGKRAHGGATFVYGDHPYVLVHYRGDLGSLLQLAHEVGHAVHADLAHRGQPFVYAHFSSLTGEAVAGLHEGALVDLLLRRAATREERGTVLDHAVQNLLRLFHRPALDAGFELALYDGDGVLTGEELARRYLEALVATYGDSVALEEWDGAGWMTTPHFYDSPLYMGRYPLAAAAATALLARLTAPEPAARDAARRDLAELLAAGASDDPLELLRRAGVDLRAPATLAAVVDRMDRLVSDLEALNPPAESSRP